MTGGEVFDQLSDYELFKKKMFSMKLFIEQLGQW
jgi:hypothetical protein